jgi:hypothetical protein
MTGLLQIGHRRRGISLVDSSIACDERLRPYRQLAIRVLSRAVLDATDPTGSANDRESARAFLAGSAMLEHWCHVAALDPNCIAANLRRLTQQATTTSPHLLTPPPYRQSSDR